MSTVEWHESEYEDFNKLTTSDERKRFFTSHGIPKQLESYNNTLFGDSKEAIYALTDEEQTVLKLFRSFPAEHRANVLTVLNDLRLFM